jgi:hypothetical protein
MRRFMIQGTNEQFDKLGALPHGEAGQMRTDDQVVVEPPHRDTGEPSTPEWLAPWRSPRRV